MNTFQEIQILKFVGESLLRIALVVGWINEERARADNPDSHTRHNFGTPRFFLKQAAHISFPSIRAEFGTVGMLELLDGVAQDGKTFQRCEYKSSFWRNQHKAELSTSIVSFRMFFLDLNIQYRSKNFSRLIVSVIDLDMKLLLCRTFWIEILVKEGGNQRWRELCKLFWSVCLLKSKNMHLLY